MALTAPQAFKGTAAPAARMIGGPSTEYYSNTAYTRHGEPQYNANDFIRPLGEAFANLMQGGSRRAQVTEETIDLPRAQVAEETINLPQTPPRSPRRANPEHPHRPEKGFNLRHTKTEDLGSTQPLLGGDLSDPPMIGLNKKRSYTYPNTDPAVLFKAIKAVDIATVEKELKNGAALEVADRLGFTPLWRAVDVVNIDEPAVEECAVIKLLVDNGANYNAKVNGQTVLQWALDNCRADIAGMICDKMDETRLGGNATREDN